MKKIFPDSWLQKFEKTHLRELHDYSDKIDFASNDYLGFVKKKKLENIIRNSSDKFELTGSTGSRLISGNKKWIEDIERKIAHYHHTENALIYPSAYQANIGLFSCIAGRNDLYIIDECAHASVIDGVRLSFAKHFKFHHNDLNHLKCLLEKYSHSYKNIFVVTEGLFSMDGDSPNAESITEYIGHFNNMYLIVDETHSFGTMGKDNLGLFNDEKYAKHCLARIIGYGKALGFSGGAVTGSEILKKYLINFSRSFIFSTALPLYHYQFISVMYDELINHSEKEKIQLKNNIQYYLNKTQSLNKFSKNNSPIQYFLINKKHAADIQNALLKQNIYAKAIFPPTVADGTERIRISLHSFNTCDEIDLLIHTLKNFIS